MQADHPNPGAALLCAVLFGDAVSAPPVDGVEAWLKAAMYLAGVAVAVLVIWEKVKAFREGARKEGDEYAKKADIVRIEELHNKLDVYVHTAIHELRDQMHATGLKLEVVCTEQRGLSSKADRLQTTIDAQTGQLARLMTLTELRIDRQKDQDGQQQPR